MSKTKLRTFFKHSPAMFRILNKGNHDKASLMSEFGMIQTYSYM